MKLKLKDINRTLAVKQKFSSLLLLFFAISFFLLFQVQLPVNQHRRNLKQFKMKPGLCFRTFSSFGRRNAILNCTNTVNNSPQIKLLLRSLRHVWLSWTGYLWACLLKKILKYHIATVHCFM